MSPDKQNHPRLGTAAGDQGLAKFFHKGPENKYFKLWELHVVSVTHFSSLKMEQLFLACQLYKNRQLARLLTSVIDLPTFLPYRFFSLV